MKTLLLTTTFLLGCLLSLPTRGDFVYESFDYPSGDQLVQKSGGVGFSGAWSAGAYNAQYSLYNVTTGSLAFGNLSTSGNSVRTGTDNALNGIVRATSEYLVGNNAGTRFLSFLIRRDNTSGADNFGGLYIDGSNRDLFIGKGGQQTNWGLEERGVSSGAQVSDVVATVGDTTLLVVKMVTGIQTDAFTLYVNPTPGQGEPGSASATMNLDVGDANQIALYNGGNYTFDEIRIGDSFAEVTPTISSTPEPSTLVLAALGLSPLLASRMRKRYSKKA